MITTAARSQWPSDQPIKDLDEAGLRTQCVVRFKLFTLENRMIERSIGSLGEGDREAVSKQLSAMLG